MAEFTALDALTAPAPTERQLIIRFGARIMVERSMLKWDTPRDIAAKAACIMAAGDMCQDAALYLAELTLHAWARLAVDTLVCAQWISDEKGNR